MYILVIIIIFIIFLFITNFLRTSFIYPNEPILKASEYRIVVKEEKDSDGNVETRYYPMEKFFFWRNLWFEEYNGDNYPGECTLSCLSTTSVESAVRILRARQEQIGNQKEIKIEYQ